MINGVSTKLYKDGDWDNYRNHSVGFVFQTYNLIPHQTVLSNVELALTLSGIAPKERKERAAKALEKVGLGDQLKKLPAQLSGGQMQRVAIARAIVNEPDIILADEPTGALDTETSIQIMNILKEIAKEKLVVMVTHNPELAEEYSTRIIRLKDGTVREDTNPFEYTESARQTAKEKALKERTKTRKKPSMSLLTALSLSLKNLGTKKARTLLTSFAGSIGIIGIALILSLSTGFSNYIDTVQRDTLTNYPVTITTSAMSMSAFATSFMGSASNEGLEKYPEGDEVIPNKMIGGMLDSLSKTYGTNDLSAFKEHLDEHSEELIASGLVSAISYGYNFQMNLYQKEPDQTYRDINKIGAMSKYMPEGTPQTLINLFSQVYPTFKSMMESSGTWGELLGKDDLIRSQYDLIAGSWPTYDRVNEGEAWPLLVVVDEYNRIPDYSLYMMGLLSDKEVQYLFAEMVYNMLEEMNPGAGYNAEQELKDTFGDFKPYQNPISIKGLVGREYKAVLNGEYYEYKGSDNDVDLGSEYGGIYKTFVKRGSSSQFVYNAIESGVNLKVCGVVRLKKGVSGGALSQNIYYTPALTDYLLDKTQEVPVVKEQLKNDKMFIEDGAWIFDAVQGKLVPATDNSLASTRKNIGLIDKDVPVNISIYPTSFENKDAIIKFINDYNASQTDKAKKIQYTDYIGMMIKSITTIIDAITYVLIAFVSISLIVSSIMIGVITYISVLERTKEIGILRSIGASKRDISRVFNAETMIIGFVSGGLGILITVLLNIPISILIEVLAGISGVAALPVIGGVVLVAISVLLTLVAGLIPSKFASKRDPVIALRSE